MRLFGKAVPSVRFNVTPGETTIIDGLGVDVSVCPGELISVTALLRLEGEAIFQIVCSNSGVTPIATQPLLVMNEGGGPEIRQMAVFSVSSSVAPDTTVDFNVVAGSNPEIGTRTCKLVHANAIFGDVKSTAVSSIASASSAQFPQLLSPESNLSTLISSATGPVATATTQPLTVEEGDYVVVQANFGLELAKSTPETVWSLSQDTSVPGSATLIPAGESSATDVTAHGQRQANFGASSFQCTSPGLAQFQIAFQANENQVCDESSRIYAAVIEARALKVSSVINMPQGTATVADIMNAIWPATNALPAAVEDNVIVISYTGDYKPNPYPDEDWGLPEEILTIDVDKLWGQTLFEPDMPFIVIAVGTLGADD